MNGHKSTNTPAGVHASRDHGQAKGDRFSDLLVSPDTHAQGTSTQTQKPAQKSAQKPVQKPAHAPTKAGAAKTQAHDGKNATTTGKQAAATPGPAHDTHVAKASHATPANTAAPHTDTGHTNTDNAGKDQDQNHKADAAGSKTLPINAQDGITAISTGARAIVTGDTNTKDTKAKDADTAQADKKGDGAKKGDPKQPQNGDGVAPSTATVAQIVNAAANTQVAPQANPAATDKSNSNHSASANANISGVNTPGTATPVAGAAVAAANLAAANLKSATGHSGRNSGKTDPGRDTGTTQATTPSNTQDNTGTADPNGNPAASAQNKPATDMLAALKTQMDSHTAKNGSNQTTGTVPPLVQTAQTPVQASAQQSTQNNGQNNNPASASSQTVQTMIPDPSSLGMGNTGLQIHTVATLPGATMGTGPSTSTGAGAAQALMPQTLQGNQMPLPLPNMAALGIAIATRSLSGSRQFDIRLDPPALGRVDVRLSIDSTGKAQAHLSADQQQTLTLLQKDSSGLARALRDAGLNVAQNGLNFSLRQHSSGGGGANHGGFSPRGARTQALSAGAILTSAPSILPLGTIPQFLSGHGRLDISV